MRACFVGRKCQRVMPCGAADAHSDVEGGPHSRWIISL